jgi:diguanylate cyclase (GGDEF)-like protein/PAS domain S-box-containing protein
MLMREAASLAATLERTSANLAAADAARAAAGTALRELNQSLERRVADRTAALTRQRQLLDAIVENIPVMITLQDAATLGYQYFNAAAARLLPAPRAACIGSTPAQLFAQDTGTVFTAAADAVRTHDINLHRWERPVTLPDGQSVLLSHSVLLLRTPEGAPEYLLTVALDVTAERRAEEDLRLAATAFDAQEPMLITDPAGAIVRANRAFCALTGYSAAELAGQNPRLLHSGRHDEAFFHALWAAIGAADAWQGELWNRRRDGTVFPCWCTISAIRAAAGTVLNYVAVYTDITAQKRTEEEIRRLAFYDALTGLPNRRLLLDRLQHALAGCARSGRGGALMFIDLDNFKTLNDTLGHDQGDALLRQVAARLPGCVRDGDTVARLGGDEFVLLLEDLHTSLDQSALLAEVVAGKVLGVLAAPYQLAAGPYHCLPSVGVAVFGDHHTDIDEVLKHADLAMYEAKAAGGNAVRFFEPAMQDLISAHARLEAELRTALRQGHFVVHYQPQVGPGAAVVGAEALLRWQAPGCAIVLPDAFIGLAEETGLILGIGRWVLEAGCAQLARWATRPRLAHLSVSVNVSARQFAQPDFVAQVHAIVIASGADPRRLKLELTESALLADLAAVAAKIDALRRLGITIALDDFGVGYSSLSYLRHLNLDQLKIDRSFIDQVAADASDAAIARTIVTLAHTLGLSVVAEGVETPAQRDFLHRHGCHIHQGFLYAQPLPPDQFEAYAQARPAPP